jgi:hypothetical protein
VTRSSERVVVVTIRGPSRRTCTDTWTGTSDPEAAEAGALTRRTTRSAAGPVETGTGRQDEGDGGGDDDDGDVSSTAPPLDPDACPDPCPHAANAPDARTAARVAAAIFRHVMSTSRRIAGVKPVCPDILRAVTSASMLVPGSRP